MKLDAITIPDRARRDLGDIAGLAESIRTLGLLHPIVVTDDGRLVAGQRRLAAASALGWAEVPVTVATTLDSAARLLIAERDENTCRKDMTISEKVELGRAIEAIETTSARDRMVEGGRRGGSEGSGRPTVPFVTGETRDKVGEALGMSGTTYSRAKAVVAAAESGDVTAVALRERMDQTGKVNPVYDRLPRSNGEPSSASPRVVKPANGDTYAPRQIQNAEAIKARVWQSLHMVDVVGQELPSTKFHLMAPATTSADLVEMVEMLDKALRSLRGFRDQLKTRSEA